VPYTKFWNTHTDSVPQKQAREDLLLLLYCTQSLEGGSRKLSVDELLFALPSALTLAEAGQTIEERRIGMQYTYVVGLLLTHTVPHFAFSRTLGYLFCAEVLPRDHEMQLLIINTIRKVIQSL
jgi:AP-4 complex subunit epsilon-1